MRISIKTISANSKSSLKMNSNCFLIIYASKVLLTNIDIHGYFLEFPFGIFSHLPWEGMGILLA